MDQMDTIKSILFLSFLYKTFEETIWFLNGFWLLFRDGDRKDILLYFFY
jgi:hypothetical protein